MSLRSFFQDAVREAAARYVEQNPPPMPGAWIADQHLVATGLRQFADDYEGAGYLREAHALRNAAVAFDQADQDPETGRLNLFVSLPHGGWEDPTLR